MTAAAMSTMDGSRPIWSAFPCSRRGKSSRPTSACSNHTGNGSLVAKKNPPQLPMLRQDACRLPPWTNGLSPRQGRRPRARIEVLNDVTFIGWEKTIRARSRIAWIGASAASVPGGCRSRRCRRRQLHRCRRVRGIAQKSTEGTNLWFKKTAAETDGIELPPIARPNAKCGSDTLDVWIDSGSPPRRASKAENLSWPADLYLEGRPASRLVPEFPLDLGYRRQGCTLQESAPRLYR